jgi:phosphoribosylglycinamide formyltransferase-1
LRFASEAEIPWVVIERSAYSSTEHYSRVVFNACRDAGVDLVVMGGFLKHVLVPEDFVGRVMNIHPSLIPAFCGKGFYGHKVHAAAIDYGVKVSGCTVHWVDDHYDHGPIILQRTVEVLSDDTPEKLAARVFAEECEALPDAIRLVARGRLRLQGRRVVVLDELSGERPR